MLKSGAEPFLGAELAHIRPEINLCVARREGPAPFGPMGPATIGAIAFAIEPSLIAAHHFSNQSRCIRPVRYWAGIRAKRFGEHRFPSRRNGTFRTPNRCNQEKNREK